MQLIFLGLTVSIFLMVLAVGMRVAPADLPYVLSTPSRLVRSLRAMNVLGPIVAVIVCKMFSLHPAVIVALVTLAIAPVSALFSQAMLPLVAPGNAAYARGLFFASPVPRATRGPARAGWWKERLDLLERMADAPLSHAAAARNLGGTSWQFG
jgi:BASS family bile acid:Na+ symporter